MPVILFVAGFAVGWFLKSLRQAHKAYRAVEEWRRDGVLAKWRASGDVDHFHHGGTFWTRRSG